MYIYQPFKVNSISSKPYELFLDYRYDKELEGQLFTELLNIKEQYAISGQLFQVYMTLVLAYHENPFTLALERKETITPAFKTIVMKDIEEIFEIFHYHFHLDPVLNDVFYNYELTPKLNQEVHDLLSALCIDLSKTNTPEEFYDRLYQHYMTYGVGFFGLNKAFRFDKEQLVPIQHVDGYLLHDIVGYESQKQRLVANTQAFLKGMAANNVLLYGDSGTGKSSSIKAILNEYYHQGLRIVEVYKHQFQYLPDIIHLLQNRNYKFIIYMDDLSFEDFEIEYKYLKSVIEGGLEQRPSNIIIYATSNRKNIIKQSWSERDTDEVNLNDAMQEKNSLVRRFGITILYSNPMRKGYLQIVDALAKKNNIDMDPETLHNEALTWEIRNGGFSGRTATQFINYILGAKTI